MIRSWSFLAHDEDYGDVVRRDRLFARYGRLSLGYRWYFPSKRRATTTCMSRCWRGSPREITRPSRWRTSLARIRLADVDIPSTLVSTRSFARSASGISRFRGGILDTWPRISMWKFAEPSESEENHRHERAFWFTRRLDFCCRVLSKYHPCFKYIQVGVINNVASPWSNEVLRNPENSSYIPNWFSPYTRRMSFLDRSINTTMVLPITKLAYM